MAKGINLLLFLFSSLVFVHQRNDGVSLEGAAAVKERNARDQLQSIYTAELGVREKTGKNDGQRVEAYLAYTHLGKGYAWCASFVSWVYGQAGYPEPRTAWSPALFPAKRVIWRRNGVADGASNGVMQAGAQSGSQRNSGEDRVSASSRTSGGQSTTVDPLLPQKGDVFGIYFNNVKRIAHAGFVDEWGDKYVITVEGNTNEAGSREGDGVYRKRRPISSIYQVARWL